MHLIHYTETGLGRNNSPHHHVVAESDLDRLTRGGREVYRRTRRPSSTCNVLAEIAGIGVSVTER